MKYSWSTDDRMFCACGTNIRLCTRFSKYFSILNACPLLVLVWNIISFNRDFDQCNSLDFLQGYCFETTKWSQLLPCQESSCSINQYRRESVFSVWSICSLLSRQYKSVWSRIPVSKDICPEVDWFCGLVLSRCRCKAFFGSKTKGRMSWSRVVNGVAWQFSQIYRVLARTPFDGSRFERRSWIAAEHRWQETVWSWSTTLW